MQLAFAVFFVTETKLVLTGGPATPLVVVTQEQSKSFLQEANAIENVNTERIISFFILNLIYV